MRSIAMGCGALLLALCAACGGGGGSSPPAVKSGIGPAGGTVSDPSGAKVVIPAGALATETDIAVALSSAGAPAMPAGITVFGPMVAFTPHGTTFAVPVTITVPFDPASVPAGTAVALYKTNASQSAWEVVSGATVSGSTMTGNVSGFSFATAASVPTTSQITPTQKNWSVDLYNRSGNRESLVRGSQTGGAVDVLDVVGERLSDSGRELATYFVHSNESGRTFWAQAVAPVRDPSSNGVRTSLTQTYYFRVDQELPTLRFLITHASVIAFDGGGAVPGPQACPWLPTNPTAQQLRDSCAGHMTRAETAFHIEAHSLTVPQLSFRAGGALEVTGVHQDWRPLVTGDLSEHALFRESDFVFDDDADGTGTGRRFLGVLREPKTVELPINQLHKDDIFSVQITITATAINRIQGESLIAALLQDPLQAAGIDHEAPGHTQIAPRDDIPTTVPQLTCATGPDPAAGVLQFSRSAFSEPERSDRAVIIVERTGGTTGEVGVHVKTHDASAIAGADYTPVSAEVRFADGESGQRRVEVPLVSDDVAEEEETLNLELSDVGGCAQLSATPTATLTILDDDRPLPPPATYTVGGTVTGLVGSGLVLRDSSSGSSVTASNGSFTLPEALVDGTSYDVRVETPPSNPAQQCTVTNGLGTIGGADVTNIQVSCAAPPPGGGLDLAFGIDGRVTTSYAFAPGFVGARIGMALQSDGRILLVGGLTLLRFNSDGTLDSSFGTSGKVSVPFNNSVFDTAQDVAVQVDGKIVVIGVTSVGGQDDFALARFNTDGSLDASFGAGGKTSTDFRGSTDRARRVRIQPDGKIVVAGTATLVVSSTQASVSFAMARYNPDGTLDTSFATGGKARDSVAGDYDLAQGIAFQSDGKVILAGSAANNGVDDPDIGLIRYHGDTDGNGSALQQPGWRDETFGIAGNGTVQSDLNLATGWEEADDVAVTGDGTIVIAGRVRAGATVGGSDFGFVLATFTPDGHQKGGALITKFSTQSDSARSMLLQSDGKIVVVGQSASLSSNPDMAIVRYDAAALGYDTSFGTAGKLTLDFFGGIDSAEAVVQQPDGKLVVGGYARFNGTTVLALARLNP